MLLTCSS